MSGPVFKTLIQIVKSSQKFDSFVFFGGKQKNLSFFFDGKQKNDICLIFSFPNSNDAISVYADFDY
jgi:hypothetical protein